VNWIKKLIDALSTKPGPSMSTPDDSIKASEAQRTLDLIKDYFSKSGGLTNVLKRFEDSGFVRKVRSWVSTGPNEPLNSIEALQLIGQKDLDEMAKKSGISVEKLRSLLAELLPIAVDRATPRGRSPRSEIHVVTFTTQKGGSGKSTTAASLAVAAYQQGHRVFLLDLDQRPTLANWIISRQSETGPEFAQIDATLLDKTLATLEADNYDLAVIDTPNFEDDAAHAAMRVADLCLIPCRPTSIDLYGTMATVRALTGLNKPFAFVLTQCPPDSSRIEETRTHLSELGLVADPPILSRADYQDAMAQGLGVTEFNADGAAAAEIRLLWAWVENKLKQSEEPGSVGVKLDGRS
jgi:chromosome partitioning protein